MFARPRLEPLEDRSLPTFSPAVSYPVGEYPQAVLTADLNNDGLLDLAVANSYDGSVSVLVGRGDGTFDAALSSATGDEPLSLAAGDFDGDGNLDLATANYFGPHVSVLMGNGDGTFQPPIGINLDQHGLQNGQSVAVGDFNGDGNLDLGVLTDYYDYDRGCFSYAHMLLGNGDGSFSGPNSTFLGFSCLSSAVAADFNGDGLDDFRAVGGPVAAGDLDADGDIDMVTANSYWNYITVVLNDGLGGFGAPHDYVTGPEPVWIVLGDFTGDGKADIATVGRNQLSVLSGRGDGTFSSAVNSTVGSGPLGAAAGDFNDDGWLDAATANSYGFGGGGNSVSVLINDRAWVQADAPSATLNDVTVTEGNTGSTSATFTVTLSAAYSTPITVHYETANGSAAAGSDYTAASGEVTFTAGQTTQTITVAVLGDRLPEATETFVVNLTTSDVFLGEGQAVGSILDDEPRISISNVSKKEGNGKKSTLFTFTVALSVPYDQPITMSYSTTNGTATTGNNDYVAKTGTLTFAPGETTKTITIEVKGDRNKESNEVFYLDLFGLSSNALFTKSRGIGTILNDD